MVLNALEWFWYTYRPREGWLSLFLLVTAVACLVGGVLAVGWVNEDYVVAYTAILGLLFGVVLAKRPLHALAAWTFILLYGLLVTTIYLARLWPPLGVLWQGWQTTRQFWLQNGALFVDRAASWFQAVSSGGRSEETVVFAFLLGLSAWLLAAYVGWSAYRQQRPLLGLTLMGLVVAVNGYYGQAPIYWAAAFVGVAVLLTAVLHFATLEQGWLAHQVDYSPEVRVDLILYAGGVGLALLALSFLLPAFSITRISEAVLRQPAVAQVENTLGRAFAGVEQPRITDAPGVAGRAGGRGAMPRAFLLSGAPELTETVMMLARATADADVALTGRHWRALSYEVYTGRGWTVSEERRETVPAGAPILLPAAAAQTSVVQEIEWLYDRRPTRYTLGLPLEFGQEVVVSWRGLEDLVRVQGRGGLSYTAVSRVSTATAAQLRGAAVADVPPAILARYTALPEIPQRVAVLAAEVAGDRPTAYDQALALESFLRQYTYSLDVPLPPPDVDLVDYFLFDLQQGYCDYYASAMVVMARSLGLPARLAVGFLAQPPDARGVQTIRQINAHSWAEIYFAGYGWIEFEPTAPFVTTHETAVTDQRDPATQGPPEFAEPPPIPERVAEETSPWPQIVLVAALAIILALVWWQQRQPVGLDAVELAYGRLQHNAQKLGQPTPPSQTPTEFGRALRRRLEAFGERPRLAHLAEETHEPIAELTALYERRQYSGQPVAKPQTAVTLWQRLRRPLWLLRLAEWLRPSRKGK